MFIDEKEEPFPVNGTLEEKAAHGLEQVRSAFYSNKKIYEEGKEGGSNHTAYVLGYGQHLADNDAKRTEHEFQTFLKNAYLTEDGQTTDPRYPVDKMVNRELRRIRAYTIITVTQFMYRYANMMPEKGSDWNLTEAGYNFHPFFNKYNNTMYKNLTMHGRLKPHSTAAVMAFCGEMILRNVVNVNTPSSSGEYVSNRMRDQLIEFLLQDIPFNNKRLEQKTELIADEKVPNKEDKPILH